MLNTQYTQEDFFEERTTYKNVINGLSGSNGPQVWHFLIVAGKPKRRREKLGSVCMKKRVDVCLSLSMRLSGLLFSLRERR